jgi:EAL and modified HD-GYP domain-containing signal transduction protein
VAEAFVARQPICDRERQVVAYELLFRPDVTASVSDAVEPDAATARTVIATLTSIGLDALVGDRAAYLNVTREFILAGYAHLVPPERVALELLEDTPVDARLLAALRELKDVGYRIVLDDFVWSAQAPPLVELADVVKLDVLALGEDGVEEQLRLLGPDRPTLVAEKVENYSDFEHYRALGFEHFQGNFLYKPKTIRSAGLDPGRMAKLDVVAQLQNPALTFDEIDDIIRRDVALTYRLLRYVNSAFVALPFEVDSIRQALVLVGSRNVRSWAALMLMAGINGLPDELLVTALVRARMCELLAAETERSTPESAFLTGLLSVVEALAGAPMEIVLDELPITDEVRNALLHGTGELGDLLDETVAYERGDFSPAAATLRRAITTRDLYIASIGWAGETMSALGPEQQAA